jgi:hypothetical protein
MYLTLPVSPIWPHAAFGCSASLEGIKDLVNVIGKHDILSVFIHWITCVRWVIANNGEYYPDETV